MKNVLITPTQAATWLAKSNEANPKSRDARVPIYAARMTRGTFNLRKDTPNSQNVIAFDTRGRLVNGHTRLKACVSAGVPFRAWVEDGVHPDEFLHADSHEDLQVRSLGQVIAIDCGRTGRKPPKNVASVAQATRLITSYLQNDGTFSTSTGHEGIEECLKTWRAHPQIEQLASKLRPVRPVMSPGVAAALAFAFRRRSAGDSDKFFDALISGSMLAPDSPIQLLRHRLITAKTDRAKRLHGSQVVELTLHVWNAVRAGRKMTRLPSCGGKIPSVS